MMCGIKYSEIQMSNITIHHKMYYVCALLPRVVDLQDAMTFHVVISDQRPYVLLNDYSLALNIVSFS